MRHKLLVLLVVVLTTFVAAREGLRQFESLKAEAEQWATSKLLAGFLDVYAPGETDAAAAPETVIEAEQACAVVNTGGAQPIRQAFYEPRQTVEIISTETSESAIANSTREVAPVSTEEEHHAETAQAVEQETAGPVHLASLSQRRAEGPEASERLSLPTATSPGGEDVDAENLLSAPRRAARIRVRVARAISREDALARRALAVQSAACPVSAAEALAALSAEAQARVEGAAQEEKETASTINPRLMREIEKINKKLALDIQHLNGVVLNAETLKRIAFEYNSQRRTTRRSPVPVVQRVRPLEG